ncbi:MAG: permease-like cell division protein FtsX [Elusimicrobia bacterium]|nr:permease-like cell division protein FtsX [Elusimicrobiota bacterium]
MNPALRRSLTFALAAMAGLAGESLLLVRTQVFRFENLLREDFRVLMFLKNDLPESQAKILEDKLLGLSEVSEARFVSRDAALADLRRDDPELVDSVTWMGDNPLRPAFEVRPAPAALGRFEEWLASVRGVADWADLRYRSGQVRAILQAQLYGHYLSLILSSLLCLACAALAAVLWWARWPGAARPAAAVAPAGVGAAVGLALALAAAWPARQYLPWWEMPAAGSQFAVWAAAALAAGLFSPP